MHGELLLAHSGRWAALELDLRVLLERVMVNGAGGRMVAQRHLGAARSAAREDRGQNGAGREDATSCGHASLLSQ